MVTFVEGMSSARGDSLTGMSQEGLPESPVTSTAQGSILRPVRGAGGGGVTIT